MQSRLYTVKGRVQGVWFRDSARREAERLNIAGYAINLDNGDVEVLAVGEVAALEQLTAWLRVGPPMAEVSNIDWVEVELVQRSGFQVG